MKTMQIFIFTIIAFLAQLSHTNKIQQHFTNAYPTFDQYIVQFNRTYANNKPEYEMRKAVYEYNIGRFQYLRIENGFQPGVNQFTDRTDQQMSELKNYKLEPLRRSQTPHFSINRKLGGPSSLDWRAKGAVTPAKNQGFCGSCWAFATAGYCQSSLIINNGYKNNSIDLSEQYLLECTQESDCKGGFPAYALLTVLTNGIPRQQTYPYSPLQLHEGICDTRKALKIKGKQVYVYFRLSDLEMIYLLQSSPIIVGVGSQDWEFYKGGIMKCKSNVTEDHAVLLVGYTKEYWIVKNNWGENWGENGFIRISRNRQSNCLMGIEVDVLYSATLYFATVAILIVTLLSI